jgi:large subunit ribosomal protein L18
MALKIVRTKKEGRLRRATKGRSKIKTLGLETGIVRLTLHRSLQHIYAQLLSPQGGKVLASASTLELRKDTDPATKSAKAEKVGFLLGERALREGIARVACDRSGFLYHGRIAALVGGLRNSGVQV